RDPVDDADIGGVDGKRSKILLCGFAEKVVADVGNHHHFGATQPRRHRLVGTLAAEPQIEFLAKDRFAGTWKPLAERSQIHIGAANHSNFGRLAHPSSSQKAKAKI